MVGVPTEFISDYSLFYTNRGQKKLYELLGIRTLSQFDKFLQNAGSPDAGISPEDLEKMIYAGLIWQHKDLKLEAVEDIVESYYMEGHDYAEFNDIILTALAESGLINKKILEAARSLQKMTPEEIEQKIMENAQKKQEGADMGEQLKT